MQWFLVVLLLSPAVSQAAETPLFAIERSLNANKVIYSYSDHGTPNIQIAWRMDAENGRRESLSGFERNLAYGLHHREHIGDDLEFSLQALPSYSIYTALLDNKRVAKMNLEGREQILEKVFVQSTDGLLPSIAKVTLHLRDPISKAQTTYEIVGKAN